MQKDGRNRTLAESLPQLALQTSEGSLFSVETADLILLISILTQPRRVPDAQGGK